MQSLRLQVTHLQEALDAERAESGRRLENIQALRLELDTARKDTERARLEVAHFTSLHLTSPSHSHFTPRIQRVFIAEWKDSSD